MFFLWIFFKYIMSSFITNSSSTHFWTVLYFLENYYNRNPLMCGSWRGVFFQCWGEVKQGNDELRINPVTYSVFDKLYMDGLEWVLNTEGVMDDGMFQARCCVISAVCIKRNREKTNDHMHHLCACMFMCCCNCVRQQQTHPDSSFHHVIGNPITWIMYIIDWMHGWLSWQQAACLHFLFIYFLNVL